MSLVKTLTTALLALSPPPPSPPSTSTRPARRELETVKGIGPAMSTRIVDARKTGPFADWGDLQSRVKGVGHGNATKFSADGLTVNGAAYAASAKPAAPKAVDKKPVAKKAAAPAAKPGQ